MPHLPQQPDALHLADSIPARPEEVSAYLVNLRHRFTKAGHPAAKAARWELVLAELLNNIVEHAYEDRGAGMIQIDLWLTEATFIMQLTDTGLPMPDGKLPEGRRANIDTALEDLPEGGFGWALIHDLVDSINYTRRDAQNHLHLRLAATD